jgi:hypothetical protein
MEDNLGVEVLQHRKEWGRAITSETVDSLFDTFFASTRADEKVCFVMLCFFPPPFLFVTARFQSKGVVLVTDALEILSQVVRLRDEIKNHFYWSLYAGSILLIRDAGLPSSAKCSAKIALVDFSYAYPEPKSGHDNLLYGVKQLENRLQDWIERKHKLKVVSSLYVRFFHFKKQANTTLLFVRDTKKGSVLLAMKKRGLGIGKLSVDFVLFFFFFSCFVPDCEGKVERNGGEMWSW